MNKTKIEWVKNPDGSQGYSWNPITGCLAGCGYCYARKLANGRLRARYLANSYLPSADEPDHEKHLADPFYPRFWPERLKELHRAEPRAFGEERLRASRWRATTSEWVQDIVDCADAVGVPVFLKENLVPVLGDNLRQELPAS